MAGRAPPPGYKWATPMPAWKRLYIGLMSLLLLIVSLAVLAVVGSLVYAFGIALLNS